jgi:hypothetical protein
VSAHFSDSITEYLKQVNIKEVYSATVLETPGRETSVSSADSWQIVHGRNTFYLEAGNQRKTRVQQFLSKHSFQWTQGPLTRPSLLNVLPRLNTAAWGVWLLTHKPFGDTLKPFPNHSKLRKPK